MYPRLAFLAKVPHEQLAMPPNSGEMTFIDPFRRLTPSVYQENYSLRQKRRRGSATACGAVVSRCLVEACM